MCQIHRDISSICSASLGDSGERVREREREREMPYEFRKIYKISCYLTFSVSPITVQLNSKSSVQTCL